MDEVISLDPTKLKAEERGERIVCKIQEWLISETTAGERAALPEDVTQHLPVSVSMIFLNVQNCTIHSLSLCQFVIPSHLFLGL